MAEVGVYYVTIMPDMSGFSSNILKELELASGTEDAGRRAGNGFMSGFGSMIMNAGSVLIGNLASQAANAMLAGIGNGIQRLDTLSIFPKVMENMGIDAESSAAAIERVRDSIVGLPTSLDDAARAVQRLTMSTGDIDRASEVFIAFNNALVAGAAPASLQASALEQFSQAVNKGKPDMLEWRSLMNAMPAQLNQVAMKMGLSAAELGEGLRQGTIPMDDFLDAIVELNTEGVGDFASFSEQVTAATSTIGVAMTNVRNRISQFWEGILGGVGQERIAGFINTMSEKLPEIGRTIGEAISGIISTFEELGGNEAFQSVVTSFGEFADSFSTVWNEDLKPTLEAFLSAITGDDIELSWENFNTWLNEVFIQTLNEISSLMTGLSMMFDAWHMFGTGELDLSDPSKYTDTTAYGAAGTPNANTLQNGIVWNPPVPEQKPEWVVRNEQWLEHVQGESTETNRGIQLGWERMGHRMGMSFGSIRIESSKTASAIKNDFSSIGKGANLSSFTSSITSGLSSAASSVETSVSKINGSLSKISSKTIDVNMHVFRTGINGLDIDYDLKSSNKKRISVHEFAAGGILDRPTFVAGEAGAEAVIPLTNPAYVRPFARAIATEMGGNGSIYVNAREVNSNAAIRRNVEGLTYASLRKAGML